MADIVRRPPDQDMVLELARRDFSVFVEVCYRALHPRQPLIKGWYFYALTGALGDVAEGRETRLIVSIPPRHLKSFCAAVCLPAFMLGRDPTKKIICISYANDLSDDHSRIFRRLVETNLYRAIFPQAAASIDSNTANRVGTSEGGYRMSTGIGGALTGFGADVLILDDPIKAQDAGYPEARERVKRFVDETMITRLNSMTDGAIVSIQQRLHQYDVVAHLLDKGVYRHLELPAIAVRDEEVPLIGGKTHFRRIGDVLNPDRESREALEGRRQQMGPRPFAAQYQQCPLPSQAGDIRWEDIRRYEPDAERRYLKIVHSWDPASSINMGSSFSAGTIWGYDGASWDLLHIIRAQLTYTDLLSRVRFERDHGRWKADVVLVENASNGHALLDELSRDMRGLSHDPKHHNRKCIRYGFNPRLSKEERLQTYIHHLYDGIAKLPREAPWLDDLRREMMAFPDGNCDQIDSITQFLHFQTEGAYRRLTEYNRRNGRPVGRVRSGRVF